MKARAPLGATKIAGPYTKYRVYRPVSGPAQHKWYTHQFTYHLGSRLEWIGYGIQNLVRFVGTESDQRKKYQVTDFCSQRTLISCLKTT